MPPGFFTAGRMGPVEARYKREKSGATPWAVFMGLTSLALFVGSGSLGAPAAIIGALALLLCLILSVSAASSSRATLALHQGGLELTQGSNTERYHFDEVTSVWHAGPAGGGSKEAARAPFTIEFSDKRRLTLKASAYADSARLATALAAKLGQSLLVRELKEIRAGRPVTFGPVRVDSATISNGSQTLPWAAVDGVRAHAGAIEISQQGRWTRWAAMAPQTPNTLALPGIASAIRGLPPPP